jgi:hypothetical protein
LPTCTDGAQYCLTSTECIIQGHFWYNNVCNLEPEPKPTCADSAQYCTKKSDCVDAGYFWYANSCHLEPEIVLTCANGIQYCTKKPDCTNQGYYWYNNSCQAVPEPTCSDGAEYCTTKPDCADNGFYWYGNSCHTDPEPVSQIDQQGPLAETTDTLETALLSTVSIDTTTSNIVSADPNIVTEVTNTDSGNVVDKNLNDKVNKDQSTENSAANSIQNDSAVDKEINRGNGSANRGGGSSSSGSSGGGGSTSSGGGLIGSGSGSSAIGGGEGGTGSTQSGSTSGTTSGSTTTNISGPIFAPATSKGGATQTTGKISSYPRPADDGVSTPFTITDLSEPVEAEEGSEAELDGTTYAELRNQLLNQKGKLDSDSQAMESVPDQPSREDEQGIMEGFIQGIQKLWNNVVNWFSGLGGNG